MTPQEEPRKTRQMFEEIICHDKESGLGMNTKIKFITLGNGGVEAIRKVKEAFLVFYDGKIESYSADYTFTSVDEFHKYLDRIEGIK